MKRKLLVVLLVLSFVLVGCGQKDYTDVDLYKDMVVQKYKEIDKDFFKSYNEALSTMGIKKSFNNMMDSYLDFIDESLDLLGDKSEEFYNKFKTSLDQVTEVPFSQEDINKVVEEFEALPDELQDTVTDVSNKTIDLTSNAIDKGTKYIKNLTAEQVAKFKEGVKALVDEGEDVYDATLDYIEEQLGN